MADTHIHTFESFSKLLPYLLLSDEVVKVTECQWYQLRHISQPRELHCLLEIPSKVELSCYCCDGAISGLADALQRKGQQQKIVMIQAMVALPKNLVVPTVCYNPTQCFCPTTCLSANAAGGI